MRDFTNPAPLGFPPPDPAVNKTGPAPPVAGLGGLRELGLFLLGAVALFLVVQVGALLAAVFRTQLLHPELDWSALARRTQEAIQFNPFFLVPVQLVFLATLTLFLYVTVRYGRGLRFAEALALRALRAARTFPLLLGGFVLALVANSVSIFFPPPQELPMEKLFSSRLAVYLVLGTAVLIAPVVEELLFRGYLYTLLEPLWGRGGAVLTSGVLFGAIHFPQLWPGYFQMATLCVVGVVFSLVRARTGSTTAAILLHLSYNVTLSASFLFSPEFQKLAVFLP